jgi:hypothetical protein
VDGYGNGGVWVLERGVELLDMRGLVREGVQPRRVEVVIKLRHNEHLYEQWHTHSDGKM